MQCVKLLFMAVVASTLSLAAHGGAPRPGEPPEITSESEGGFHDLVFRFRDRQQLPDGTQIFKAHGRYKGQNVGLELALGSGWTQVSLGTAIPVAFQGSGEFKSLGPESDALLMVMDQIYGTKLRPVAMKSATTFTCITLEGDPRNPGPGIVKMKLFFEPANEDDYAELYLNIDMAPGKIYLKEKDPDYRVPVIKALGVLRDGS